MENSEVRPEWQKQDGQKEVLTPQPNGCEQALVVFLIRGSGFTEPLQGLQEAVASLESLAAPSDLLRLDWGERGCLLSY